MARSSAAAAPIIAEEAAITAAASAEEAVSPAAGAAFPAGEVLPAEAELQAAFNQKQEDCNACKSALQSVFYLFCELAVVKFGVKAVLPQQLVVLSLLNDFSVFHHKDDVRLADC